MERLTGTRTGTTRHLHLTLDHSGGGGMGGGALEDTEGLTLTPAPCQGLRRHPSTQLPADRTKPPAHFS